MFKGSFLMDQNMVSSQLLCVVNVTGLFILILLSASTDGYNTSKHYERRTHPGLKFMGHHDQIDSYTHSLVSQQLQQPFTNPFKPQVPSKQVYYTVYNTSDNTNGIGSSSFNYAPSRILYSLPNLISSVSTTIFSTSQAPVPVYSVASQSTVPLATSQQSGTFTSRPTRILEAFKCHYLELINLLPMNDDVFLGKLYTNNLLPLNLKAVIKALPTPVEKVSKFLDDVIKPSVENNIITRFNLLLTVMMDSNDDAIKELAQRISFMLNQDCLQSEKGTFTVCIPSYSLA